MLAFYRRITRSLKRKSTRSQRGGGKGLKPGQGQKKLAKEAAEKAAAAAGAAGGAGGEGAGAAPAPVAAETAAARCERISREVCAATEKRWSETREDQRETRMITVTSIDGLQDDGQFQISVAYMVPPDQAMYAQGTRLIRPVIVGRDFLKHPGEKKARVACPDLLKVGAYVLVKSGEGRLHDFTSVVGHFRGHQVTRDVAKTYQDLAAVIPPDIASRWEAEGKLKAVTRW
jgi:hypothetical protein